MIRRVNTAFTVLLAVILSFVSVCPFYCAAEPPVENSEAFSDELLEWIYHSKSYDTVIALLWFKSDIPLELKQAFEKEIGMSELDWLSTVCDDSSIEEIHEKKRIKLDIAENLYQKENRNNIQQYLPENRIIYSSRFSPVIIAEIASGSLLDLRKQQVLYCADVYHGIESVCSGYEEAANLDFVEDLYWETGEFINVGIYDDEVPNFSDIPSCNFNGSIGANATGVGNFSHAETMAKIIINIAPDAEYWFAGKGNSGPSMYLEYFEWLVGNNVDVISCSMTIGSTSTNSYTATSKWFDHIVYQHYVTIVTAVGNKSGGNVIPLSESAMAYNSIVVGCVETNNTPHNYQDDYLGVSTFSDLNSFSLPYKPDLCTFGSNSSMATAITGGLVAILMGHHVGYICMPEKVKSSLSACVNKDSPYRFLPKNRTVNYSVNSYMQFGAGVTDALLCMDFISYGDVYGVSLWDDLDENVQDIYLEAGETVRVSLAFLQPVEMSGTYHQTTSTLSNYGTLDLDLFVENYDGVYVYQYSTTSGNNVEIVEFTPPVSGYYQISVNSYNSINSNIIGRAAVTWIQ